MSATIDPRPTTTHHEPGDVLTIGRRFRAAHDRHVALAEYAASLPAGDPAHDKAREAADRAAVDSRRMFYAVFNRRGETLADAAVLAAHAFELVDAMDPSNLEDHIRILRWALANITVITARAAPLYYSSIGLPALPKSLRATLGGGDAKPAA